MEARARFFFPPISQRAIRATTLLNIDGDRQSPSSMVDDQVNALVDMSLSS